MLLREPTESVYTIESVREIETNAVKNFGISIAELMQRASTAVLHELRKKFNEPREITVFCGSGNNAGDGYLLAALAARESISVRIIEVGDIKKHPQDVINARDLAMQSSARIFVWGEEVDLQEGIIIDGLIGTGLRGELYENYRKAIETINGSKLPVISIDVPSGLDANSGSVDDLAVTADLTVTFVALKQGLFTGRARAFCGEIILATLEIPRSAYEDEGSSGQLMNLSSLLKQFPKRSEDAHKRESGHVMVIGGDHGFGGAAIIAAQYCAKMGAGLVSLCTRGEHVAPMLARQPEVMAIAIDSGQDLESVLDRASVLVLGPGLGQSAWSEQLLQRALNTGLPVVLDADALNIIASGRFLSNASGARCVMTPHPGEAARLLGASVKAVEKDRYAAVKALQKKYSATILLKGAGTLILCESGGTVRICTYGNSGMASAGMGDALAGMIGALMAQGMSPGLGAELGCCVHSAAADLAAERFGQSGMTSTDLLYCIRSIMNSRSDLVGEFNLVSREY